MKTVILKWSIRMLFIIGLWGCTDEYKLSPDEDRPSSEEYNYISFSLTIDNEDNSICGRSAFTRSEGGTEITGAYFERKTKSIKVILYDPRTMNAAYSWFLDATNKNGDEFFTGDDVHSVISPGAQRFVTKPKYIKVDAYYIQVMFNPPEIVNQLTPFQMDEETGEVLVTHSFDDYAMAYHAIQTQENGYKLLTGMEDSRYKKSDSLNYVNNCLFFMSNFKKDQKLNGREFYDSPEKAIVNARYIQVDRVVARVQVDLSEATVKIATDGEGDERARLGNLYWRTDRINKQWYWVRQPGLYLLTGEREELRWMDSSSVYAEDPNFDNISRIRNPNSGVNLSDHFFILLESDLEHIWHDWEYVTENTMAPEDQYEDVTTRVIMKFNLIPKGFAPEEGYYWFKGYAISIEDMVRYKEGTKEIPGKYSGLNDAITELQYRNWNFYTPVRGIRLGTISFYYQGYGYHSVPIRHFRDNNPDNKLPDGYGRYGIVRNNIYSVKVGTILGPGVPTFPDPEGPDNKSPGNVSLDLESSLWYERFPQETIIQ